MPNERILIIDGEPELLRLCRRILSPDGYDVYTAGSAQQAVAIVSAMPLDLVIVDVRLPDKSGISTFETLHTYQPDAVGIITSSYPSLESALEALHTGISGFVIKPFTPAELRHAVSDALQLHRLDQENARLKALIPLYELSRSLMTTTDWEALFEQVIEIAIQETGADRVSLMIRENDVLTLVAAKGLPADMIGTTCTQIGDGVAGWVAKHGQPLLLDETVSMPPELADALTQDELASAVCAPLTVQGHVIGVLNLSKLKGTDRLFTPSDRDLISVLAGQVAIAVENARLFRQQHELTAQLASANAKLRALQEAATAMTSRRSPGRVLETTLDG